MKELIGFNNFPNDFVNISLRAKLSKKYGFFGKIPMWGGVRLHQFYPPLSTILVRMFGLTGTLVFYFLFTSLIWMHFQGRLVVLLFLLSYYHLPILLYVGRLSEFLGYSFVALAFFIHNPILSGIALGLAGLCYPLPFLVGLFILLWRFQPLIYIFAFLVCGWWYIPFILDYKKLSFLKEKRKDKIFGLYYMQWASLLNFFVFILGPFWLKVFLGIGLWFLPVVWRYMVLPYDLEIRGYFPYIKEHLSHFVYRKPFFLSDLLNLLPGLDKISEKTILIEQPDTEDIITNNKDKFRGSLKQWIWASAAYLLDKGIIVYNGLPSTEVPNDKLSIPNNINVYTLEMLGYKGRR